MSDVDVDDVVLMSWGVDDIQEELSWEVDDFEEELSWGADDILLEVVVEFMDLLGEAFMVAESGQTAGMAELYDSGCTNHISPYKDQFENFQTIVPRHFHAVNKQTFSTISKGEHIIDIPNGNGVTQLRLYDVLYSAEVGYTLVSIGRLDEPGSLLPLEEEDVW